MENTFTIDYATKTLSISFAGGNYWFDLTQGDTGDFWDSFVTSDDKKWDVNFYQEDETCEPSVEVYPAVWVGDENGCLEIDTNNGTLLTCVAQGGGAEEYFGSSIVTKPLEIGDVIGGRFKVSNIINPASDASIKEKLQDIIARINECGIGAWNADLENTVEAVALEDFYGDVESDEPTVKYNGWYESLEKLVESL